MSALDEIGAAREVDLAVGGSTVTIWAVRVDDRLYIRSWRGASARWYRNAQRAHAGRIGDVDVELVDAPDDVNDAVDAAYRAKYGSSAYTEAMTAPDVRATTMEVLL